MKKEKKKKNMKYIISFISMIILSFTLSFNVYAVDSINSNQEKDSNVFKNYISRNIANIYNLTIIDKQGRDITEEFYKLHYRNILNKDYANVYEYCKNNVSKIISSTYELEQTQNRSNLNLLAATLQTVNVSQSFYEPVKSTDGKFTDEIAYTISGSYTINTTLRQIISYGEPSLSFIDIDFGPVYTTNVNKITTSGKISTDKQSVTYTARFKLTATLNSGAIGVKEIDYGYHGNSFTAHWMQ